MYMGFFGIIDAVVVLLGIIFMFIGYKKGFMGKMITIVCVLVLLGLSITLCGHLAEMFKDKHIFYDGIYDSISETIHNAVAEAGEGATVKQVIAKTLHLPEWIAALFVLSSQSEVVTPVMEILFWAKKEFLLQKTDIRSWVKTELSALRTTNLL